MVSDHEGALHDVAARHRNLGFDHRRAVDQSLPATWFFAGIMPAVICRHPPTELSGSTTVAGHKAGCVNVGDGGAATQPNTR